MIIVILVVCLVIFAGRINKQNKEMLDAEDMIAQLANANKDVNPELLQKLGLDKPEVSEELEAPQAETADEKLADAVIDGSTGSEILGCLLLGSAYVAGRRSIGTMSRELRAIVDIMNQILEAPEQVPAEPYKQGELGELYTNLYKLVQALKESNRKEQEEKIFLRDIMSDISHQLKTPLASLTVFLDLLYDGRVPDVDKQKQMLLESKNQVSRMEWMVLSMLKLARIEAGAIQFEKHPCSLYAIVAQAKESVAYLTEKRGQQIDVQIDEKQMLVCDGDWL